MLNFRLPVGTSQDTVRSRLNEIAARLGYVAKAGPAGSGGAVSMLLAIASGECVVVHRIELLLPSDRAEVIAQAATEMAEIEPGEQGYTADDVYRAFRQQWRHFKSEESVLDLLDEGNTTVAGWVMAMLSLGDE